LRFFLSPLASPPAADLEAVFLALLSDLVVAGALAAVEAGAFEAVEAGYHERFKEKIHE
jgi:hypothetical protein